MRPLLIGVMALAAFCLGGRPALAQKLVVVTVPANVSFQVQDISVATGGSPSPMVINVVNPTGFSNSDKLRILTRAEAATFTGPGGSFGIPASAISWTADANRGTTSDGTLSTTYTEVYRSPGNFNQATVQVEWFIGPFAATGVRAGSHTLSVRWRFEVF